MAKSATPSYDLPAGFVPFSTRTRNTVLTDEMRAACSDPHGLIVECDSIGHGKKVFSAIRQWSHKQGLVPVVGYREREDGVVEVLIKAATN